MVSSMDGLQQLSQASGMSSSICTGLELLILAVIFKKMDGLLSLDTRFHFGDSALLAYAISWSLLAACSSLPPAPSL